MTQRVIATIGAPGSGKSTFTETFDPKKWVTLTLDDFRTALWPPHRRTYWEVRKDPVDGPRAQKLLHNIHLSSFQECIFEGWNVILADQHHTPKVFQDEVDFCEEMRIKIEWVLFDTPWETILARNSTRPECHRLPEDILKEQYDKVFSDGAWWRYRDDIINIKDWKDHEKSKSAGAHT